MLRCSTNANDYRQSCGQKMRLGGWLCLTHLNELSQKSRGKGKRSPEGGGGEAKQPLFLLYAALHRRYLLAIY